MKKTMGKVTRRLIKKSLGRFLSIMLLTMLGSMTLIGDIIEFSEKTESSEQLKRHTHKVTGFINSSEIIADNTLGPANTGSGALSGYAVVAKSAFKQNVPVIARIRFKDLI